MAIPVSTVVDVSIAVGAQFPARAGFGTLNIVTAESGVISRAERIRSYASLDGVTADWDADSEVAKAATSYFSQNPRPTSLMVSVRFPTAQAAELRGGSVTANDLTTIQGISDGSLALTIDGVNADVTGMDFSSDVGGDQIAATLQTSISAEFSGATCTYEGDETSGRFYVKSGTTGASSTILFARTTDPLVGTDVSSLLQLQQGEATKANGGDAESIADSLTAINDANDSWYGLMFTKEVRDGFEVQAENAVEAAAAWCEARVKVFVNTSNDLDVLDSVTTNDIASVLKSKNYRRTMTTFSSYPNEYPSASIVGRAFTVNFNQPNSTLTLKFKQMPGITVEDLSVNQKNVLDSKCANALIDVGGSDMFAESFMANSSFFDELHGLDWLTNAIQTNIFGYLLTRTTKVPYTDKGVASVEQQLIKALDEAVRNGLAAPGTTIDGEFLEKGYKTYTVPVADVNQSDKEARFYGGLSFTLLGAGAIHKVQVNGTFER